MMRPEFAIVDANTLSCLGMKQLLEDIIPMAEISVFHSFEELVTSQPERFMHFFVASGIFFENANYFISQPRKSIVLVRGNAFPHINGLLTLNVCQEEKDMVKALLKLQHRGHGAPGQPTSPHAAEKATTTGHVTTAPRTATSTSLLSSREAEVAILLAKGYINKEVADRLCISLTTVISHRKNIMEKLKARSLADIIVHVVMSGLISVDEL